MKQIIIDENINTGKIIHTIFANGIPVKNIKKYRDWKIKVVDDVIIIILKS